jgi:hypothetical protein
MRRAIEAAWRSASGAALEPMAEGRAFELGEPPRSLAVFAGSPTPYGRKVARLTVSACDADAARKAVLSLQWTKCAKRSRAEASSVRMCNTWPSCDRSFGSG